ncbi:hypothetical protein [Microbacterium sp. PMB16]|uniref:hypothetical protein n=1 Tax=Microbacterium sp. PMB16 TaxID=3120157 RepID=UPI003F4C5F21
MRIRLAGAVVLLSLAGLAAPAVSAGAAAQTDVSVRGQTTASAPFTYREAEPAGRSGRNDSTVTAERISAFGTSAPRNNRLQLTGQLSQTSDADYFAVQLRPGDVLGASVTGSANIIGVTMPDGTERVRGIAADSAYDYPPSSPLPRGGNSNIAYVAEQAGWYAVEVAGASTGTYTLTLEAYRPGTESDTGRTQTVLIDFRGGTVDTRPLGTLLAKGVAAANLSPLTSFLPLWGIPASAQNQLEETVIATVRANLQTEVQAGALNPRVNVVVLNARTHPELVGQTNVSQVHVAGKASESQVGGSGIAQYIDPGNFSHEDLALVQVGSFSGPANPENRATLNNFLHASSDRVKFVGTALGNIVSHEIGHTIGLFHTDPDNDVHGIIDSGGRLAATQYGLGADGIGGTADDVNTRFGIDSYLPNSADNGLTGTQNSQNVVAWAYAGR